MLEFSFRVLGPLEVVADEVTVDLGSPRQRTVLAILLALANQGVSSDRLVDEIWGESAPKKATHSLQTYVSNLRRILGRNRIETRHPGYVLHVNDGEFDRELFDTLVADGRQLLGGDPPAAAERLSRAISLWRGEDPYAGFADEVPVLSHDAARLRETRLVALEYLAEARLALGEHDQLVSELQELTVRFPYREGLWSLLMRALYLSGRQAEALGAYRTLRNRLVEELGIDPSPELQELEFRLLTQTEQRQAVRRRTKNTLPAIPSRLIGRERELHSVAEALEDGRLVTVTGPAGVGKTRLVIESARQVVDRFTDGAYFVDLATVSAPEDVPSAVASGLRLNDQSGRPPVEAVTEFLEGRHLLLVLDNCEHLTRSVARLVWRWVSQNEVVHVLASSQDRLDLDGERVLVVAPLGVLDGGNEGVESDAVKLFITRAREQVPDFAPTADDLSAIPEICRLLDGLPLAIELAAARVESLAPTEIVTRLDDRFALLSTGKRWGPARHQTLRSAVEWSHSLLDEQEGTAFDRLSILSGEFSLESAEATAGLDTGGGAFLDVLEALVKKSLVKRVSVGGASRYRMLETLRLFGLGRLRSQDELEELEHRRASVFSSLAIRQAARVHSPEFEEALAQIDADLDNLRQSFRWAVDNSEFEMAFDLTRPLWSLVSAGARRHLHEGNEWRESLLADTPIITMRARLLSEHGFVAFLLGDQNRAIQCAEESLSISQSGGPHEALAVEVLALCAATNGDTERAIELAERDLEIAGDTADAHGLETMAMALIFGGRGEAAVGVVEGVFEEAERQGDPLRRIRALALMGAALQGVDLERSRAMLDDAVVSTEELGMDWDLAGAVMARALTRSMSGDLTGSLGDLEWACRLTYQVRDYRRLAQSLEILGALLGRRGNRIEAVRVLSASESLRKSAGVSGSKLQRSQRLDALEQLEHSMSREIFAKARQWGQEVSAAEAARFGASIAAAVKDELVVA